MKNLICLLFFISFFSFSQEEIPVIDFASGEYPIGEKVKIYFDKDWRPIINIDSALYYRLIKFKEKNIPLGRVTDFHITSEKQMTFYSSFIGLSSIGIDSVINNGVSNYYYKNGNISLTTFYLNNSREGVQTSYHESGKIKSSQDYIDDLAQGQQIGYYESGETKYTQNYVDNLAQGQYTSYYKSGEVEFTRNYVDGLQQGQQIGYYKSGETKYTVNYVDNLAQGQYTSYYKSGEVEFTRNFVDGLQQGQQIGYYKSGETKHTVNYVDDLRQGQQIGYYESGETQYIRNFVDDLRQGQLIFSYESGLTKYTIDYVDDLAQGQQIAYYESGQVEFTRNWIDNLKQGEQIFYKTGQTKDAISGLYIPGEIDYTKLYIDDELKERRIALVIGNAAYEKGVLENPVNDANLIAESLEKLDFEVFLHTDLATEDEMLDAIKEFGRKRSNYEIGFVYYAGHGIQLNNENYLLPVNEEFEYEDDVEDNAVSMQRVLRYLESTRENQLNFIVLDACRDNPFESNWNKTRSLKGAGLAKTPPPTGSLIAFSTDHGQTAADGDRGNSLYSQALAEKLLEENVSIEQVFKNVRTEVLKLSGDTQSPVEESKLTGDVFYLNKKEK